MGAALVGQSAASFKQQVEAFFDRNQLRVDGG
jgi:hypothetical protein